MTLLRRFAQVDVFSARPYLGNPVAVIVDAEGMSGEEMRRVARWTNLSETTFLLPPQQEGADYWARIFTPTGSCRSSCPDGSAYAFEIRAFAPGIGVPEAPVTGALNASVAQWLTDSGQADARYTVSQGTRLGRAGEVVIEIDDEGAVWVGGATTVCFTGTAYV